MKKPIIISIVLLILIVPYFVLDQESVVLDQAQRDVIGGSYIKVEQGTIHYKLTGLVNGPLVVLVHGFSAPMMVWDYLVKPLEKAGYRVLRYDLFGRGFSDRPNVEYNADLFNDQLSALISALKIKEKFNLIGLSMGGAISVKFAAENPDKIKKLVLFDPAGFPVNMPIIGKIIKLPILGDYLMKVLGDRSLMKATPNNFYDQKFVAEFREKLKAQTKYIGFKRAILSTLRHMNLSDMKPVYEKLGTHKLPTLLFWGDQDKVIPFKNHELVAKAIPHLQFISFKNVGHIPNYEVPDKVMEVLIPFLNAN